MRVRGRALDSRQQNNVSLNPTWSVFVSSVFPEGEVSNGVSFRTNVASFQLYGGLIWEMTKVPPGEL